MSRIHSQPWGTIVLLSKNSKKQRGFSFGKQAGQTLWCLPRRKVSVPFSNSWALLRTCFTSPSLKTKRGFKTSCFPPRRGLQTQPELAGKGKAVSASARPKKQVTWIKWCVVLKAWSVCADWQSSVDLSGWGTRSRAQVWLVCQPRWCQRQSAPGLSPDLRAPKLLHYRLDLGLPPALWGNGLHWCFDHGGKKKKDVFGKACRSRESSMKSPSNTLIFKCAFLKSDQTLLLLFYLLLSWIYLK